MANFKDLLVWQRSMSLTEEIYRLVRSLPKEETYALSDQMRRAAVSIPSNIAEGHSRNSNKDFIHFLAVARGSASELATQLEICVRLGYLKEQQAASAAALYQETDKMLRALMLKLKD